jgi:hypothetical protein
MIRALIGLVGILAAAKAATRQAEVEVSRISIFWRFAVLAEAMRSGTPYCRKQCTFQHPHWLEAGARLGSGGRSAGAPPDTET